MDREAFPTRRLRHGSLCGFRVSRRGPRRYDGPDLWRGGRYRHNDGRRVAHRPRHRLRAGSASRSIRRLYARRTCPRELASTPEGSLLCIGEIAAEIDRLIGLLAFEARISRRRIYEVVIAGNTCMLHLAANVSPEPSGRYPYTPALSGGQHLEAKAIEPRPYPGSASVYIPPVFRVSSARTSRGDALHNSRRAQRRDAFRGHRHKRRDGARPRRPSASDSTAAGPAFEGMNIACGMRRRKGPLSA